MKTTLFNTVSPEMASAFAKKLYPASMIGTMGEVYFRTRQEMDCPRGAVSFTLSDAAWISLQFFQYILSCICIRIHIQIAGFVAQIITVLLSIPMVSLVKNTPGVNSFIEVDWLHFTEALIFWASIHVQAISFRQALFSVENGDTLPVRVLPLA